MMVFVLMSGLFTPVESMPDWAQWIAFFNPISHYIEVIRGVVLKSSTFTDLMPKFWILLSFAFSFNVLALLNFSKRTS
jgi:ABC-2 type transport system permease protein